MPARAHGPAIIVLAGSLLCLAIGCDDDRFGRAYPIMQVGGDRIEYGSVPVGSGAYRSLVIQNPGLNTLHLTASVGSDPTGVFGVAELDAAIPAGGQGEISVSFIPDYVKRYDSVLVVEGDDPDLRRAEVALGGWGYRQGIIEVEPELIDFGTVAAGQVGLGEATIRNAGNGDLVVTGIALGEETNPDYQIVSSTRTPADVAAGGQVILRLAYRPGLESVPPGEGELIIEARDPFQPVSTVRLLASLNQAPIADAGPDREVDPFDEVMLDGSASRDPDGHLPLSFDWSLVRKPDGSSCELFIFDPVRPVLIPDLVGIYEALLYVTDDTGLRSLLPDRVAVTAVPAEKLLVELVWDSPIADLDLHLLAPGGGLGGLLDCFYNNRDPDWGQAGDDADDPHLLRDDLAGFGPETIAYGEPVDGTYQLLVHYFAAHTPSGREPTSATLRVFVDGILAAEVVERLESQEQLWTAVGVKWPEGTVYEIDVLE
ncbi:MAG: choice-of-anchor D domain-containing protein [Deltaproteobacteria bacterium]|nr:choice-of-anchor D domain-containing protein [Deltaproteobacteria bacterium]